MGALSIRDADGGPGQLAPDGDFYLSYLNGAIPPGFGWITATPIPNFGTSAAPITAGPSGSADLAVYANVPEGVVTTFAPVNPDGSPLTLPSGVSLSGTTLSWTGAVVALVTLKLKPTVDGTPLSGVLSNTFTFVVGEPDTVVVYEPLAASGYTGINPSSFTPSNPGDLEEGNYILWPILDQTNTATIATPENTELLFSYLLDTRRRFYLFGARAGASEPNRTFLRTGGTSGSVTDQVFCQPHRLANVPATSIISVQPVKQTNSSGAQNVAHAAITPASDQEAVLIYVTKRDTTSTALSKTGFTQAFCFGNPSGSGPAGQTGTLGLVYDVQEAATAVASGSVTVTGGSATAVSTSYILTIKRTELVGEDDSPYLEMISAGQPLTILPGHYGQGTDTFSGRDLSKCWKFFIVNDDATNTSLSDGALAKNSTLKCLSGNRLQAGLVANPDGGNGPVYVFDMRREVHNPGGGINMNGNYKWWTTAWAPGAPIYRNCKFSVNGSRAGVDNVTTWNSDDQAGGNWRNRDAISIGGSSSLQLDHIFIHNVGFARFSDEGIETFYRPKNLALLYMFGYDPLCFNDHEDEQYPELLGPHGFGSFMRGEFLNFGRSVWAGMQSRAPMDNFWRSNLFNCLYFANHPPRGSVGGVNKYHSSTAYTCIDLDNQASGVSAYDTNRRHNVLGNIFMRGYYQSTTLHAIGGNGMEEGPGAGTGRAFIAKNHVWGYASAPATQNAFRWESHPVSSTLLTEAWHPSFGANHETVRRFGVADLLTNAEMLAAIDIFEATCGAHPRSANRVARELAIFAMKRNMVNGLPASSQYEPPNSCGGSTPFDVDDWYDEIINPATNLPYTVPLNGGRFLPNAGGTPSITPQSNFQGTYADTLDFMGIPQNAATAGAAYSSGTLSNGRDRTGYNPIDVSIIERKWTIGNVKL